MPKKYFIGTSGFIYEHWKGRFYPKKLLQKDWFGFYNKNFNTVEINYSFYRWPSEKTIKNWHKRASSNFKFTLKAPRIITHVKKLKDPEKQIKKFYKITKELKENEGAHLFQLPPSFKNNEENFERVKKFLDLLDSKKENVIEFRDSSWWEKKTYELLRKNKITFCVVSGLKMPEEVVLTSNIAYFRFHGNNYSSLYSSSTLKRYSKIMKNLKVKKFMHILIMMQMLMQ